METENIKHNAKTDVIGRAQIHISEIWKMVERQREINSRDLNEVDFLDENNFPIKVDQKIIDDFKFCGLNNIDFITSEFYKKGLEQE